MKKINVYTFDNEIRILSILGFDEENQKIIIIKGHRAGKNILKDRFFSSKILKHISIKKSGEKKFFEQLPFCFDNCSRMWAKIA